jgi:S1-C subfamily serine protease
MRFMSLLPALGVAGVAASAAAQTPRAVRLFPGAGGFELADQARAVIGVTTAGGTTSRDTLGVFVSSVRAGSPAEKAGIEEGNRIASINGVSLKLAPGDVGDDDMAGVMTRRLTRELDKLKPGDEVDLHVYASGQTKIVKVKTVAPEDLYESMIRRRDAERPTLGIAIGSTGSARDSLGVFVMGVDDGGPAAKAGIEEGSRIASINGVDVRGRPGDEDGVFRSSNVSRLEREISRLKPGDDVDLRVYFGGTYRDVKLKAGRVSDLQRRSRGVIISHDDALPPMPRIEIDGSELRDRVRRAVDDARFATTNAFVGVGKAFGGFGNRVSW